MVVRQPRYSKEEFAQRGDLIAIDSKPVTQMLKSGLFESVLATFADLVDVQKEQCDRSDRRVR